MKTLEPVKDENDLIGLRLKENDGLSRVAGYLRHNKVEVKILLNNEGKALRLCRLRGTPTFYILDHDGRVSWSRYGESPCSVPLNQAAAA